MVSLDHAHRSTISAHILLALGAELGVPGDQLLARSGLHPADLDDPQAEISARAELAIITDLVRSVPDARGLGLVAGQRYHLSAYGLWSFLLISSPTPRSAVEIALRYLELTFSLSAITSHIHAGELQLMIDPVTQAPDVRRFLAEREAAAIHTIATEAFGDGLEVRRTTFDFPAPPEDFPLCAQAWSPTAPEYDATSTLIAFDPALLDRPMPQANIHAVALAEQQCTAMLARRRNRAGVAGEVRQAIARHLPSSPSASDVARELHLSSRTLQRRLQEEDVSFRRLLDEVRQDVATNLLMSTELPVADIARRVGYVEMSSFSQAFRRWEGMSPSAFRRS